MKDKLVQMALNRPERIANELRYEKNQEMKEWVLKNTPEKIKDSIYSLSTRIYWLVNDIIDFPVCPKCGNKFGMGVNVRVTQGYKKYCTKCDSFSDEAIRKREQTCLERYGTTNPSCSPEIKQKIKDVNIERYGSPCSLKIHVWKNIMPSVYLNISTTKDD